MEQTVKRGYKVTDAMEYLGGISRQTLYRLFGQGDLDSYLLGTRRYITKESMDHLINSRVGLWPEVEDMIAHDMAGGRHE